MKKTNLLFGALLCMSLTACGGNTSSSSVETKEKLYDKKI